MIKGRIFLYKFFILIFECKNLKIFIFSIWTCSTFSYLFFELTYLSWNSFHSVENKDQIALKLRNARKRHVNYFLHFRSPFILHHRILCLKTNVSNVWNFQIFNIQGGSPDIIFILIFYTMIIIKNININKLAKY